MLIKANNYSLSPRRVIAGTRGSYGIEKLEFAFSPEWNGLTKQVTFYPVQGNPVSVLYENEPINIPSEVMLYDGVAQFTLSGCRDEITLISVTGYLDVFDSNDPVSDPALQPTPREISRIISYMQEAVSCANSLREDADDGVFDGRDGRNGVSPTVNITNITGGHRVKITDADHPSGQSFDVVNGANGQDGADGADGTDGVDGVSPTVTITNITGGHRVTITDAAHPSGQSFDVANGANGQDGADGVDGADGADGSDGADGISPAVTITSITGGHRVTITDADHPYGQSFNVFDGTSGGESAVEIVDLTENSSYHKGKLSVVPEEDTTSLSEDFDNFDYRARLDFENGKIVIEYYYPGGSWTTVKEVTNGFVFSDDICASYGHRPSVAWAFNGTCDYLPVIVDDADYFYWVANGVEDVIPYKCIADGNFVLDLLHYLLPNFETYGE